MIDFEDVLIRGFALSLAVVLSMSCSGRASEGTLDSFELPMQPPATAPCTITVEGRGTFDLESGYLPYVLACENPWAGPEALEALAIAARSTAYYYISKYGSICDGQGCQAFTCSIQPQQQHFDAVNSTRNLFLKYGSNLTYGFYVAGDGGTEGYVTYNWGLTGTAVQQTTLGWVFNPSDAEYGQNRGCLSQDGSVGLENSGWTYPDILRYYYGSDIQVPSLPSSCGGATTCDNGVAIGQTACNPSDPGAQFVCVAPGQPSNQQWQRQACASGQQCVGTSCQSVGQSCESITSVSECDAAGCAYYYCANACRPKGTDICQVCPGYTGCPATCESITSVSECDAAGCAYYYCANACRPKGSDICQVCPGYTGCGTTAVCPAYGWFCGNDGVTNGQANTLYTCAAAGQAPTSSEVCANGCQIMPENTPDYCIQANGCSAAGQAALNWEAQQLAAGNSYSNMCLAFVYYAYQAAGNLPAWLSGGTAAESMAKAQAAAGWTAWGGSCPCGAVLYWPASSCNGWAGHVVICNGDGTVSTSGWPSPYYGGSPNAQISWMNQQECSNNPVGYIVP